MTTNATAGWRGALDTQYAGQIRFTDESVNVPQGISVPDDIHVGQRTPGVWQYELIIPEGTIGFPLMAADWRFLGDSGSLDAACKSMLDIAIRPYTEAMSENPEIGDVVIYRGDCNKVLSDAWIGQIEVSGDAGSRVNCSVTVRSLFGYVAAPTTPPRFNNIVRACIFNELLWGASLPGVPLVSGGTVTPRSFRFSSNANLIDDNSYNPTQPQSLLGFVFGRQAVECEVTLVGAGAPYRGGLSNALDPASGADPVLNANVNIGGIYSVLNGLWSSKSIVVPGPADIAITTITLSGLSTAQYGVAPGSLLS